MKYIKIDNYNCDNCDCKEYDVIMDKEGDIVLIICADCGGIYEGEFEVIEE